MHDPLKCPDWLVPDFSSVAFKKKKKSSDWSCSEISWNNLWPLPLQYCLCNWSFTMKDCSHNNHGFPSLTTLLGSFCPNHIRKVLSALKNKKFSCLQPCCLIGSSQVPSSPSVWNCYQQGKIDSVCDNSPLGAFLCFTLISATNTRQPHRDTMFSNSSQNEPDLAGLAIISKIIGD